jgi:hypothetical protein
MIVTGFAEKTPRQPYGSNHNRTNYIFSGFIHDRALTRIFASTRFIFNLSGFATISLFLQPLKYAGQFNP